MEEVSIKEQLDHIEAKVSEPFVVGARVETMMRDLNKLRLAIRSHDSFAAEEALDKCERWFSQLECKSKHD